MHVSSGFNPQNVTLTLIPVLAFIGISSSAMTFVVGLVVEKRAKSYFPPSWNEYTIASMTFQNKRWYVWTMSLLGSKATFYSKTKVERKLKAFRIGVYS